MPRTFLNLFVVSILIICVHITSAQPSLQNRRLRVVTVQQPPFTTVTGTNFSGFAPDLLKLIIAHIGQNVTYELYSSPDGTVGSFNYTSRNWSGMVGELVNKRADLLIAGFTVTKDRLIDLDFSIPFLDVGLAIMVEANKPNPSMWAFLHPFSPSLWAALFGFSLTFSVLMWIGDKITPYGRTHERKIAKKYGGDKTEPYTYSEALFSSLLIFIGKDPGETTSWGLRLIVISFMFFSVISTANYTATLASFFTMEAVTQLPVNSLQDLRYKTFGVLKSTSAEAFFQRKTNIIYRRSLRSYSTWEEVMKAMGTKDVTSVVRDSPLLEFEKNRIPCNKYIVGTLFDKSNYAIAFPKNTSWNDPLLVRAFNDAILAIRESGVIEERYNFWWNSGVCDSPVVEQDSRILVVADFVGVFVLVAIFSGLGILILVMETVFYHWYKTIPNPNVVLRSIDTFFGGKNKDQSRELTKAHTITDNKVKTVIY